MSSEKALAFLKEHGMEPERIEPVSCAVRMAESMRAGLAADGEVLPMIPTYLRNDGAVPSGSSAIVIDAGGTNFRSGLVTFTADGYETSYVTRQPMPGLKRPATWEEFISFVADSIMPLTDKAEDIGFCFSYSADITPEVDGRVIRIDKEVVITGASGKLVGESLNEELVRRGASRKNIVILNDTAAVLLGGAAKLNKERYGGFIGQVSGTGTNTCCILPLRAIGKLNRSEDTGILVNLESGLYDGLPQGDYDRLLDRDSNNPGLKWLEKLTAGVYLGELARLMLLAAGEEGFITPYTAEKIRALGRFDSAVIDAWSVGEELKTLCENAEDEDFIRTLCQALFERSARGMCTNLLAILLVTGEGTDPEKPVYICAEGSLVQKSRHYRPILEQLLKQYAEGQLGRYVDFQVGHGTTLPGSAAAALLNRPVKR